MTIVLLCVLSTLLLAGPFAASALGHPLDPLTNVILTASGIFTFVLTAVVLIVTKLYQKTKASEAFVRTGAGGVKVIRDGGALIVPVMHELIRVSLQTLKLEVVRENQDALITQDKLRADIRAEFFVRVQPDRDSILQAARSLGDCMQDRQAVKAVVEDKLVSALRTAAASKTLEQLNSERDEFSSEVMKLLAEDLRSNGLVLETVTISKLDQTDEQYLKAENIFDAQGRRKIAEITQLNLTERNRLVRAGEQARKEQDVQTRRQVLDFERQEAEAQARQQAEIQKIEADAAREAEEKRILAEREVLLAGIAKTKDLELATRLQQQAIEVAEREKQQRIAMAEKDRAAAERELATAEAERERARQMVETVRVTEEANRQKEKQVIDAQALAEQMFVAEQRKADADAYGRQKQADAQKAAADAEAEAIRKRAQADAEAEQARAAGERARAMVPVDVRKAELAVEKDRIQNVVKAELEAREKHGKVAQEFEIAKLRVEAEKEVRIATAHAQASLFTKMQANLYGTTADVEKLMTSLLAGQRVATTLGGFFDTADDKTLGAALGLMDSVQGIATAARDRLASPPVAQAPAPAPDPEPERIVPGIEFDEGRALGGRVNSGWRE
ncbi:MAG: SPFH domain-containing protein [Polyangiaceae bacterium]